MIGWTHVTLEWRTLRHEPSTDVMNNADRPITKILNRIDLSTLTPTNICKSRPQLGNFIKVIKLLLLLLICFIKTWDERPSRMKRIANILMKV